MDWQNEMGRVRYLYSLRSQQYSQPKVPQVFTYGAKDAERLYRGFGFSVDSSLVRTFENTQWRGLVSNNALPQSLIQSRNSDVLRKGHFEGLVDVNAPENIDCLNLETGQLESYQVLFDYEKYSDSSSEFFNCR